MKIGYPEHPRAGGTDDLETFFGIVPRNIGTTFMLKQFHEYWPNAVRYMFIFKNRNKVEIAHNLDWTSIFAGNSPREWMKVYHSITSL